MTPANQDTRAVLQKSFDVKEMTDEERGIRPGSATSTLADYKNLAQNSGEAVALRRILELGIQIVGADEGSLLVRDANAEDLIFALTAGSKAAEATLTGQRVPLGAGITGLAAKERAVHFGAPRYHNVQQPDARGPEAVMAAPVLVGGELAGVITAVSFVKDKRFDANDARLYEQVGHLIGTAIEQRLHLAPSA